MGVDCRLLCDDGWIVDMCVRACNQRIDLLFLFLFGKYGRVLKEILPIRRYLPALGLRPGYVQDEQDGGGDGQPQPTHPHQIPSHFLIVVPGDLHPRPIGLAFPSIIQTISVRHRLLLFPLLLRKDPLFFKVSLP